MSHHNTCYRSEHYDLWFDNGFLLYGMSLILNSLPASYFRKKHVFFTSDNYFAVLQHNYNRRDTLFILLTEGNDLNFLSELPMLRLPAKLDAGRVKDISASTHPLLQNPSGARRLGAVYRAGKESYSTYQQWRSGRQHWPVAKPAYKNHFIKSG
ncbi:LuxR family transcriptional regulator [Klebsiella pneumoniae subsp. ozaenae]|uniref:LuxR family transcriptional regulator n=1 Tax=Klebsiella pneumoniae subsp. ozaenae TaxID=574 RepID=A0A378BRW4_KLEPO|nr:LuxR family transcriptional regulator [Klebsiella pneumoniae subsp. ozaenae]